MKQVSCIIPAFNEATRIAPVLQSVIGHPLISEIIVIDDGSTDDTKEIVSRFPDITLVPLQENGGKSAAVAEGIRRASNELIFLLDADLAGLTAADVTALIEPVAEGRADISISLRGNTPLFWRLIGLDYISGERVFSKEFIAPMIGGLSSLHSFGLEVYINRSIIKHRLRIAVVCWPTVHSAFKHHNNSTALWYFGINKDYIRMAFLVLRTISPVEAVWQVLTMLRLRTIYRHDS
ncbi:MAG: glycosyltransferase family 2 protein [Candidatus Paceibacterota bacterium]